MSDLVQLTITTDQLVGLARFIEEETYGWEEHGNGTVTNWCHGCGWSTKDHPRSQFLEHEPDCWIPQLRRYLEEVQARNDHSI